MYGIIDTNQFLGFHLKKKNIYIKKLGYLGFLGIAVYLVKFLLMFIPSCNDFLQRCNATQLFRCSEEGSIPISGFKPPSTRFV